MDEAGETEYYHRSIRTSAMQKIAPVNCVHVLGLVACGPGDEEQEEALEYIRMSDNLESKGDCFALIAKGASMISTSIQEYYLKTLHQTA